MSILTHKMRVNRAETYSDNVRLLWLGPPDDASGTTITDHIQGAELTDSSAVWTTAHAVDFLTSNDEISVDGDLVFDDGTDGADVAYCIFISANVVTSAAFCNLAFNDTGSAKTISLTGGTGLQVNDSTGSPTTASIGTPPASGDVILAGTIVNATGALETFKGEGGGTVSSQSTATMGAARIAYGLTFNGNLFVAVSASTRQHIYGMGVIRFPNGLPSTLTTDLQTLGVDFARGHKYLPAGW